GARRKAESLGGARPGNGHRTAGAPGRCRRAGSPLDGRVRPGAASHGARDAVRHRPADGHRDRVAGGGGASSTAPGSPRADGLPGPLARKERLMETGLWLAFVGLSVVAVLTPGPTLLAIVSHAAATGFRRTLPVVLGNALGIAMVIATSAAGVAGVLSRAPALRVAIQLAGAAYLSWHGAKTWRHRADPLPTSADRRSGEPLLRGLALVWSNPKALLFFGAVLPQFARGSSPLPVRFLALAMTFITLELTVTTLAAAAAGRLTQAGSERTLARVRGTGGLVLAAM